VGYFTCHIVTRKIADTLQCEKCNYVHEKQHDLKEWIAENFSVDGATTPICEKNYSKVVHLKIRKTFSDPEHFGHPLNKLVELLNRREFE
jgi:hypothetical protein